MRNVKKVSVIMSVYNGEAYLQEAMDGILGQTYQDWECIAVNDCSTDRTGEILKAYAKRDARIHVIENEVNLKLPASLNKALQSAEGKYIVRMDADDICRKDRIEKQVSYMETHPELALSCCRFMALVKDEIVPACLQRRGDPDAVEAMFLFFDPILHPGVIAVREQLEQLKYDPAYSCTEDLELWTRMLMCHKRFGIQEDYLMLYRIHDGQITATSKALQRKQYQSLIVKFYRERMFALTQQELIFLTDGIYFRDEINAEQYIRFIRKVRRLNRKYQKMRPEAVTYAAFEVFMAYRGEMLLGESEKWKILLTFPVPFLLKEYMRRKKALQRGLNLCREAAQLFGLKEDRSCMQGRIPCYIKMK